MEQTFFIPPIGESDFPDWMALHYPELHKPYIDSDGNIIQPLTRTVTYQVTDDCCMACTYCYQHNKHHHIMPFDVAKKFTDWLLDINNPYINPKISPGVVFDFIGGEPFMAIELIEQICDYILSQMIKLQHPWLFRHRFSLCSNGLLYFEPAVQHFFAKYNLVTSFSISIDGNKQLHDTCRLDLNGQGTYDRAIAAVQHYREYWHGYMGSKMTLAPENVAFTSSAVKGLIESGYRDIHLNCVYEEGWADSHAMVLYNELKNIADYLFETNYYKTHRISMFNFAWYHPMQETQNDNWCGGVNNVMLAVDYKGDIYPCLRYMESSLNDNQEPIIIGNIEHGVYVTEKEQSWKSMMQNVTRRSQSTDECFYCPIAEGCSWCSAYNYEKFGSTNHRATFICPMHKAQSLANAYYWNLIMIKENDPRRFKIWLPDSECLKIINQQELDMLHLLETFPNINVNEIYAELKGD